MYSNLLNNSTSDNEYKVLRTVHLREIQLRARAMECNRRQNAKRRAERTLKKNRPQILFQDADVIASPVYLYHEHISNQVPPTPAPLPSEAGAIASPVYVYHEQISRQAHPTPHPSDVGSMASQVYVYHEQISNLAHPTPHPSAAGKSSLPSFSAALRGCIGGNTSLSPN